LAAGQILGLPSLPAVIILWGVCFALRATARRRGWALPVGRVGEEGT
jgi:hypothetical protein